MSCADENFPFNTNQMRSKILNTLKIFDRHHTHFIANIWLTLTLIIFILGLFFRFFLFRFLSAAPWWCARGLALTYSAAFSTSTLFLMRNHRQKKNTVKNRHSNFSELHMNRKKLGCTLQKTLKKFRNGTHLFGFPIFFFRFFDRLMIVVAIVLVTACHDFGVITSALSHCAGFTKRNENQNVKSNECRMHKEIVIVVKHEKRRVRFEVRLPVN